MIPPKGYRLATADDLREGVEVLIPATLDADGDAAVKHPNHSRQWIGSDILPNLALIRDEAGPSEPPISPADYAIRGRALDLIRAALHSEARHGDDITIAYRVADILGRLRSDLATALRERDEARKIIQCRENALRVALDCAGMGDAEPDDWMDAARAQLARKMAGERVDVAALTERAEQTEEQVRGLRAEVAQLRALTTNTDALRRELRDAQDEYRRSNERANTAEAQLRAALLALGRMAVELDRARGGGR